MTGPRPAAIQRWARQGRGARIERLARPRAAGEAPPGDAEGLRRALRFEERRVTTEIAKDLARAWEIVRLVWQRLLP